MALEIVRKESSIRSLIDLGCKGYFPLFMDEWIDQAIIDNTKRPTKKDKLLTKEVIKRLSKHKSIERKKIIIMSLDDEKRTAFVKVFLSLVEGQILDDGPKFH